MPVAAVPPRSLWFESALLPDGWRQAVRVSLHEGRIAQVLAGAPAAAPDERHAIGLPGLPNLHSHAFQRAFAGLAEARGGGHDDFWRWRELMYRFVAHLQPQDLEAIAAQAYVEMLESGFTRVGEFHYLHHAPDGRPYDNPAEMCERIAAAAAETGIGLTLLPVLYCQGGFGGVPPQAAQRRFVNDLERYGRLHERARAALSGLPDGSVGVAPHSLRAVTPAQLERVVALDVRGPVHLHVAEQQAEVADCLAWSGQRPVQWLLDHASVDARWCLVHATHVEESELRSLATRSAVVGLCPVTEANLGDGLFPASAWLESAGRFGIGSDSNVLIDAAEELRTLEYGQRLAQRRRTVLAPATGGSTARRLYDQALAGGAQALGQDSAGIVVGASADLVSLDVSHPSLGARSSNAILDSWVFCAGAAAIDCVWRHGQKVVVAGRHLRGPEIAARYRRCLESLLA